MSFGLCYSWNADAQIKNWWWNFVSDIFFYCEDDNDAKRLAMCLVVDGDKYQKTKEAKHSWIYIHVLFHVCDFIVMSFGKNAWVQLCDSYGH